MTWFVVWTGAIIVLPAALTELTIRLGLGVPREPRPCSTCDGEGYFYVEQAGRQRLEAVVEVRCTRCHGTGLEVAA